MTRCIMVFRNNYYTNCFLILVLKLNHSKILIVSTNRRGFYKVIYHFDKRIAALRSILERYHRLRSIHQSVFKIS